jgi:type IV pilus assembly protein PilM
MKPDDVAGLITKVLREVEKRETKSKLINTVLPETATFVKLIEVDKVSNEKEFIENIAREAAHHIPYTLGEVYMSSQKIDSYAPRNREQVLVAVCPRDVVDEYTKVINMAGYIPQSLEVEALAITRSIFKLEKGKSLSNRNFIVIDMGAARSSLIFWREQKYFNLDTIEFSVSVPLAGRDITRIIHEKLQLTEEQAEKLKIVCGLAIGEPCRGVLRSLLSPLIQDLVQRLKESQNFHNAHFEGASIDGILLTGGDANLNELDVVIKEETGIPVSLANPLVNIKNGNVMREREALRYCTAIGLALKDFYL